jgi:hypothetical protein
MTFYIILKKIPVYFFLAILILILVLQIYAGYFPVYGLLIIPFYLFAGYGLNLMSYAAINKFNLKKIICIRQFVFTFKQFPGEWAHQFKVTVLEEITWRMIPIALYRLYFPNLNIYLFVAVLTLLFTLIHFYNKPIIYLALLLEFYLYFLIISLLYCWWSDFLWLVAAHLLRNQLIFFCRTLNLKIKHETKSN